MKTCGFSRSSPEVQKKPSNLDLEKRWKNYLVRRGWRQQRRDGWCVREQTRVGQSRVASFLTSSPNQWRERTQNRTRSWWRRSCAECNRVGSPVLTSLGWRRSDARVWRRFSTKPDNRRWLPNRTVQCDEKLWLVREVLKSTFSNLLHIIWAEGQLNEIEF